MKFNYNHFIATSDYPCEEIIQKDIDRTFGNNIFFRRGIGQGASTNILKAISLAFPDVGYTQGMNSLAAFFACNIGDEVKLHLFPGNPLNQVIYPFQFKMKIITPKTGQFLDVCLPL